MNWLDEIRKQGERARGAARPVGEGGECKTPGLRIRSKGRGRGLARGRGRGPLGIPFGSK